MKVYYGYDNDHYLDVTQTILNKCMNDNGIFIPSGDGNRCDIIGNDPYPNILKHILIVDNNNNKYIYNSTKEIRIEFPSIDKQLLDAKNPKNWWNAIGKYIMDPVVRLNTLQKRLNLNFLSFGMGGFELEYPEQLMCMRFLEENNKVLEIGGNIGRTAHIIQTILNNPLNHVIMECDKDTATRLRYNLDLNTYTQVPIETSPLSKSRMYMIGANNPRELEGELPEGAVEVPTISYSALCTKYNINFDTLVADCEGGLYYMFKEDPDMLNNIQRVIMENDYYEITHKQTVDAILTMKGFKCIYREKGVPWASWSCCYEYFYEVWSK